jgi:hypothetical protein
MTCLSMNEIRRMHAALCRPAHPPGHYLHWSAWRRRHQATARRCHYQRRLSPASKVRVGGGSPIACMSGSDVPVKGAARGRQG